MKSIRLTTLTFLLCAACVSPRPRHPGPQKLVSQSSGAPARVPSASLRSAERIVAYPISRYIDPNHSGVMHEAHTVYRVESRPAWNLRPGYNVAVSSAASGSGERASSQACRHLQNGTAERTMLTREEWLLEMQRQKSVTEALLKANRELETKFTELSAGIAQSAREGERHAQVDRELELARERLSHLESALKAPAPNAPGVPAGRTPAGSLPKGAAGNSSWDW